MIKLKTLYEQSRDKITLYPYTKGTKKSKGEWLRIGKQLVGELDKNTEILNISDMRLLDSFKGDPTDMSEVRIEIFGDRRTFDKIIQLANLFYYTNLKN